MVAKAGRLASLVLVSVVPVVVIPQFLYDPLGLWVWDDAYQVVSHFECTNDDCTLYRLPEGEFTFKSGWTATTSGTGIRVTPDNSPDCTVHVALIGDSFTWGPYVNDAETWANRLSQEFPSVCFDNYGQWGYNAEQAAWTLERQVPDDADYVIYFIFLNDDWPTVSHREPGPPPHPLILFRYIEVVTWKMGWLHSEDGWGDAPPPDRERFGAAIQRMAEDPRVHFVGFDEELLVRAVRGMGIDVYGIPVPPKKEIVAPSDNHANAQGHSTIAQNLHPLVADLLEP